MKDLHTLLALPASLLALTLTCGVQSHELQSSYTLLRHPNSFPEDEAYTKRDADTVRRITPELPIGLRKMGEDPGEKFFMHYWNLEDQAIQTPGLDSSHRQEANNSSEQVGDGPGLPSLSPPFLQHTGHERMPYRLLRRAIFGRDFQCPADTSACSSVGQSDLCCPNGQRCVRTSSGVGCCPSGDTCGDAVASCDINSGYTSCPGSGNGGCCVPGASCLGSGCVFYGTETVTTTAPTKTITTGVSTISHTPSSTPTASSSSLQVIVSGYTTTATVTISGEGTTQTTTVVIPTTVIVSEPSATTSTSPTTTSSATANSTTTVTPSAPVRGTSVETSSQSTVSVASATGPASCPTGFYMCSAVYLGGCCRVDRNCDTTSCPVTDSTAVVGSGVTIAAPASASATGTDRSCATGWYSCAASAGGGCCPNGYLCGASCTATVGGVSNQPKETPSSANVDAFAWSFLALTLSTALGMIWL